MIDAARKFAGCAMFCRFMRNQLYVTAPADEALTVRAAAAEADRCRWEDRFASLLDCGLLSLSGRPDKDIGLSARGYPHGLSRSVVEFVCQQIIFPALQGGGHVCLDVSGLSAEELPAWQQQLRSVSSEPGDGGALSLSLDFASLASLPLRQVSATIRGKGRAVVRYPVPAWSAADTAQVSDWVEVTRRSYADTRVLPVPASAVRPLTPLHTTEKGQTVIPAGWFDARPLTAWLTVNLDARRLGAAFRARRQLAHCLRFADNLIDVIDWPLPALRLDALLNRRVAVRLTHIGDVMAAAGLHPHSPGAFCRLQRWLQCLRNCFVHESMLLARRRGPFPELGAGELINSLSARYGVADARRLVRNRILRHRHLLALSPLSVFPHPAYPGSAAAWIDLLPAIGCADAISMAGPELRSRLSLRDWERLLRLTAAIAAGSVRAGKPG